MDSSNKPHAGGASQRARGALKYLEGGEKKEYCLEIGVFSSPGEIEGFEEMVEGVVESA